MQFFGNLISMVNHLYKILQNLSLVTGTGTFLITRGPPSAFLSISSHPFDIALLKPILAPGHEF